MEKFKTKPFAHQLECLNKFGRREYFALLAEQGTGKTFIIINNIADLWSSGELDGVLVFAPNGVHTNWILREIPKHMPDYVRHAKAEWSASMRKKEKAALDALMSERDPSVLRIFAMNWDALQTKRGVEAAEKFCKSCSRLMIVGDESQNFKNPTTARAKELQRLKKHSTYRRIMSGTTIDGSPFSAFSQFMFLDESILGTTSYFAFKAEYADMMPADSRMMQNLMRSKGLRRAPQIVARDASGKPRYRNLDKLKALIEPHSFRVMKKDCLDLPEKIYKNVYFEMTPAQTKIYEKARDESRIELNGEETPMTRLVVYGKLSQITSGYYLHPDASEPVRIEGDNNKISLLKSLIEDIVIENEKKVIIWAKYKVEIEDIANALKSLGIEFVEYHGDIGKDDRTAAIDSFENGNAQAFLGQQKAGGTGLTLVGASYMIYFSNSFSLIDRLQSEDRAHRIGQTEDVVYINLIAKGTIDESIVDALEAKESVANKILAF